MTQFTLTKLIDCLTKVRDQYGGDMHVYIEDDSELERIELKEVEVEDRFGVFKLNLCADSSERQLTPGATVAAVFRLGEDHNLQIMRRPPMPTSKWETA